MRNDLYSGTVMSDERGTEEPIFVAQLTATLVAQIYRRIQDIRTAQAITQYNCRDR